MKFNVRRRRVADSARFGHGGGLFEKMSEERRKEEAAGPAADVGGEEASGAASAGRYDLVVVGGGPAGYTAAIRAGQLGMKVACIDENDALGGTCLRVGCIPSKTLLESSGHYVNARDHFAEHGIVATGLEVNVDALMQRKDKVVAMLSRGIGHLLKKYNVEHFVGRGRLDGPGRVVVAGNGASGGGDGAKGGTAGTDAAGESTSGTSAVAGESTNGTTDATSGAALETTVLQTDRVLLATGSRVAQLPGVETDGERVVTSTEALAFDEVPGHLIVIGGGYIGVELGSVWARLGAQVTVLEYLDRILPGIDLETATQAQRLFERQGLTFRLGTKVTGTRIEGDRVVVDVEGGESVTGDKVLVSIGRTPNTADLGLDTVGIETDARGFIEVGDNFETAARGVFAVGDIIRGPMLAHKAEQEGVACVEAMAGEEIFIDYDAIPAIVFTEPEIAAVGRTEEQLKEAGVAYKKGVFSFRGNGRARTLGQVDGQVKVLADAETDRILGVHIIGPRAGDLIAEAAAAMTFGATAEDLALVTHAHPTLSEAIKEAALDVHGKVLHG